MSAAGKDITVEGHNFLIVTEKKGGVWSVEVVNSVKTAFAFDPTFESEDAAVNHASDALRSSDITIYLG